MDGLGKRRQSDMWEKDCDKKRANKREKHRQGGRGGVHLWILKAYLKCRTPQYLQSRLPQRSQLYEMGSHSLKAQDT